MRKVKISYMEEVKETEKLMKDLGIDINDIKEVAEEALNEAEGVYVEEGFTPDDLIKNIKMKMDNNTNKWAMDGDSFMPSTNVVNVVPPGVYKLKYTERKGIYIEKQKHHLSDELIDLPIPEVKEIVSDIELFWDDKTKAKFRTYDLTYKRGIIVYGPPGNGKSMMMQLIIKNILKKDGVIFTIETTDEVEYFTNFVNAFRKIEPNRPLIVIMEDIDNLIEVSSRVLSGLMNILDGVNQIDNVVYLATTNYPEKLQERLSNRPSRFDRKYELGSPVADVRRKYILSKMKEEDVKTQDIDQWVKKTEGYSLSHIKELIVSVCILNKDIDDVLSHFESMKQNRVTRTTGKVGFNN